MEQDSPEDHSRSEPPAGNRSSATRIASLSVVPIPSGNGNGASHVKRNAEPPPEPVAQAEAIAQPLEPVFVRPLPTWKRIFDIVGSGVLIVLFSPLMLAAAVAVKLTSSGPVIFKQARSGWGAQPFDFYKFRSMYADAEARKHELARTQRADRAGL